MRGRTSLLALAASLGLAAPAAAADEPVAFGGSLGTAYNPSMPTIKTGDTVTFSGSFSSHPLVWDNAEFGETNSGSSMSFSFEQPGVHPFHCRIHQGLGMTGTLTVVADQHPAPSRTVSVPLHPSARTRRRRARRSSSCAACGSA